MDKLLKDEIVICVINAKANLTQFKEYKVLSASYAQVNIINDNGEEYFYSTIRFIRKSKMREIRINKIIKY